MSERIPKADILNACIQKQRALIVNFNQRIEELSADVYEHGESLSQSEDRSAGKLELLSTMEEELAFVRYEMTILEDLDPDHEVTQPGKGAVVVTDKRTFFIAVSSEQVEVGDSKVFGMSEKAPLFGKMRNLKKGDQFTFNDVTYTILDIY